MVWWWNSVHISVQMYDIIKSSKAEYHLFSLAHHFIWLCQKLKFQKMWWTWNCISCSCLACILKDIFEWLLVTDKNYWIIIHRILGSEQQFSSIPSYTQYSTDTNAWQRKYLPITRSIIRSRRGASCALTTPVRPQTAFRRALNSISGILFYAYYGYTVS